VRLAPDSVDETWRRLYEAADVVLYDPPLADEADFAVLRSLLARSGDKVVCAISPAGLNGDELPVAASDVLVQAVGGLMAVTGEEGGRPEFSRVPIAESTAAVIAVTSILAALRVRRRDGRGQSIDLSLIEVMADQLRTHLPQVLEGMTRGFRLGCRHSIAAPWNAYRARDGWMLICSASDVQWRALLGVIGRPDLISDPRFATAALRREHVAEVDAIVQSWVDQHDIAAAVAAIETIELPAGPAQSIAQVVADEVLRAADTVRETTGAGARKVFTAGNAMRLSRTPPQHPSEHDDISHAVPRDLPRSRAPRSHATGARPPLEGVRVVEISRYAAGPLAGMVLASLGAEVIKIESPGGEDCRGWLPCSGAVSGYFANYNAGKRSLVLDLRTEPARGELAALIANADVVLQNLRPGTLERMGFGPATVTASNPRAVYASISGFGLRGPKLAALDTVMQGRLGLTAVIGDGDMPLRIGYSIADQLAGHYAAAGILAALTVRERSGLGQIVDIAMSDAIAWLTQVAWNGGPWEPAASQWETRDGWAVADAERTAVTSALAGKPSAALTRAQFVHELARHGIIAAPVLEVDEVLAQPIIGKRSSLHRIDTGDGTFTSIFAVPLGLTLTPALRAQRMARLGADAARFTDHAAAGA
jgi:crotonobetainyl-CoA:carnitine CoA-transferase CaiB-like acyl-CoA transferase